MKSKQKYNKSQKRQKNKKNKKRSVKNNDKSFLGIRAFACALRKKFIGGGDFRGEICDFTPLTSSDFDALEETIRIPIDSGLNLIVPESETCIKAAGGNNRVCTKICKTTKSGNKEVIYRESIRPIIEYTDTSQNELFELFNDEMKLQIMFAEKGLAPEVYMYGLINVSEPPPTPLPTHESSAMILPPPPPTSLVVKTFCVIEQKNDFFKFVDFYYRTMYEYLRLRVIPDPDPDTKHNILKYKQRVDDLSSVFNELIHKIMDLYDEIARMGYLFTDLKPENIVYSREKNGTYKVFMIDFDTRFSASSPDKIMNSRLEKVFAENTRNATGFDEILRNVLKTDDEERKIQMRASVMKYLFCAFMIVKDEVFSSSTGYPLRALMEPNIIILRYMHNYAKMRNLPVNLPSKAMHFIADHIDGLLTINGKDIPNKDFMINPELLYVLNNMLIKNIGNIRGLFYKYFKNSFAEREDLLYRYCYLSYNDIERLTKREKPEEPTEKLESPSKRR